MLYYTDKEVGKTPVFAKNLAPKFECACVRACARVLFCVFWG